MFLFLSNFSFNSLSFDLLKIKSCRKVLFSSSSAITLNIIPYFNHLKFYIYLNYYTSFQIFLMYYAVLSTFIIILYVISSILSDTIQLENELNRSKSYECGFNPFFNNSLLNMNLHYFKICLIFLIFDLEILYIYPWALTAKLFLINGYNLHYLCFCIFFLLVLIGVLYEFLLNAINFNDC